MNNVHKDHISKLFKYNLIRGKIHFHIFMEVVKECV